MAFDLNSQYEPALGPATPTQLSQGPSQPPGMEALIRMILPLLLQQQQQRAGGVNTLVRGLQTLKGGGRRDSLTGGIMSGDPLQAQQEHDAYWEGLFTPPAEAIAKERARFDPMGLRPEQKTFTEQGIERMNQTPQDRVNAAMGPDWAGLTPSARRVRLQKMHGQTPDFQDPTGQVPTAKAVPKGQMPSTPAPSIPTEFDPVIAATMAGTANPTPMVPSRPPAPAPMPQVPSFLGVPTSTPTETYRGQQIPIIPGGGYNANKGILDEAARVDQLGNDRYAQRLGYASHQAMLEANTPVLRQAPKVAPMPLGGLGNMFGLANY